MIVGLFPANCLPRANPRGPVTPGCIVDIQTLAIAAGMLLLAPLGFLILMVWFTYISPFVFGRHHAYR
jgi:hypothetical protein